MLEIEAGARYVPGMNAAVKNILERVAAWPEEDQEELAALAREIEARRTGVYTLSDQERLAVGKGLAEADSGQFVSEERVAEADKRHEG